MSIESQSNSEGSAQGTKRLAFDPRFMWRRKFILPAIAIAAILFLGFSIDSIINIISPAADWAIVAGMIDALTEFTLRASAGLMSGLGFDVYTIPETRELGMEAFYVYVWGPCSGIEGFALISAFLSIYIWMFRRDLNFPGVLLLFPIGIALSWCFNVVRISTLLFIGARVSPELAVDTFHSHAGWLMFTLLAVGLTGATSFFGWFRKPAHASSAAVSSPSGRPAPPPFFSDPNIAPILAFIVFMASAFVLQTFSQTPAAYYPIRIAAMIGVLYLVLPYLRTLVWQMSWLPVVAGLGVGLIWLLTTPTNPEQVSEMTTLLGGFTLSGLLVWIIARIVGTAILVPIIEEVFFRGYLMRKLDTGSLAMRLLAIIVSSAAFAILHQRWLAAFIAGIVFALLMLRRDRVTDAIMAHGVANSVIAAYAIAMQDWTVI